MGCLKLAYDEMNTTLKVVSRNFGEIENSCDSVYDYGARWYDPSIARFTGVDPIADKFPHATTYNYAENSPIANIDLWGLQRYYAADGKFINKVGSDNTIKIFNAGQSGESKPLHLADVNGQKAVLKSKYNSIKDKRTTLIYPIVNQSENSNNLAQNYETGMIEFYTNKKENGEFLLDNYYNLLNTMEHEDNHEVKGYGRGITPSKHFEIGINQAKRSSFKNTTDNFKFFFKNVMQGYLNRQKSNLESLDKKSEQYNEEFKKYNNNLNYFNRIYVSK